MAISTLRQYWFLAIAIVAAVIIRLAIGYGSIDDAFITFRYARNLADGLGFVYNAGERVIGTTTPLWTMIMAGLYALGFHGLENGAFFMSMACDIVTICLVYFCGTRIGLSQKAASLAALLFAICPLTVSHSVSGMETSLFTALLMAAFYCRLSRPKYMAVFAALAVLTRPEAALAVVLIALSLANDQRACLKFIVTVGGIVGLWFLFAYLYTGSLLPQSILAKKAIYPSPWYVTLFWSFIMLSSPGFTCQWHWSPAMLVGACLFLTLCGFSPLLLRTAWKERASAPILLFAPGLLFLYTINGVMIFPWYLGPLAPMICLALAFFADKLQRRNNPIKAGCFATACFLWMVCGYSINTSGSRAPLTVWGISTAREDTLQRIGVWLKPQLKPGQTVALPEIGAFGYANDAPLFDVCGLVSPEAVKYYDTSFFDNGGRQRGMIPARMVYEMKPAYIVAAKFFFEGQLLRDPWFEQHYSLIDSRTVHWLDSALQYQTYRLTEIP